MPKAVNRVDYGGQTLIDISDSTVTAAGLKSGLKAYGADGQAIIGALMEKFAGYAEAVKASGGNGFTATIADLTEITAGTVIAIRFPESISTSTDAILNVNNLGDVHLAYLGYRLGNVALSLGTQRIMNAHSQGYIPKDAIIFLVAANAVTATGGTGSLHWNIVNPQETCLFGKCTTAAATATKEVLIPGVFELYEGLTITVYFANTNSASNPTLMVNGLPAARIIRNATYASNNAAGSWQGMAIVTLTYFINGGTAYWSLNNWNNSTYSNASLGHVYGTCSAVDDSTGECTVVASNYQIGTGAMFAVAFSVDVPAAASLNINSKGAKAIYHNGSALAEGVIQSGDIGTFIYDGTQYVLLSIDSLAANMQVGGFGIASDEDLMDESSTINVTCDGFKPRVGTIFAVYFDMAPTNMTDMVVNGVTKTASYKHSGLPAKDYIGDGDTAMFLVGPYEYYLIAVDRRIEDSNIFEANLNKQNNTAIGITKNLGYRTKKGLVIAGGITADVSSQGAEPGIRVVHNSTSRMGYLYEMDSSGNWVGVTSLTTGTIVTMMYDAQYYRWVLIGKR